MAKILSYIVIFFTIIAPLSSCSTSGCLENGSAIPLAGFYSSETGKGISTQSIEIRGFNAPNDSTLLHAGSSVSEVYLPMRNDARTTEWEFTYYDTENQEMGIYDVISFNYEAIPYFVEECGAMYVYRVDEIEYSTNMIDSVVLVTPVITNADIESFKIYFRTGTEEGSEQ